MLNFSGDLLEIKYVHYEFTHAENISVIVSNSYFAFFWLVTIKSALIMLLKF